MLSLKSNFISSVVHSDLENVCDSSHFDSCPSSSHLLSVDDSVDVVHDISKCHHSEQHSFNANSATSKPEVLPTTDWTTTLTRTAMPDTLSEPVLLLNRRNMVLALLPNRKKVLSLFDGGASDSEVCTSFVSQSKFLSKLLSKLPKIPAPARNFKVGNGQSLQTRYAFEISSKIRSHSFIVKALALDTLGGLNHVIGSPSMASNTQHFH